MLVMQAMADCADDDGFAYPSVGHLAWKTGLCRSSVQNILGDFRGKKYLDGKPTTGAASTKYRIKVNMLPVKESWQKLKGRQIGASGRESTLPGNQAGSGDPAQTDEVPCPNEAATLPKTLKRNKEEPSVNHQKNHQSNRRTQFPESFMTNLANVTLAKELGVDIQAAFAAFRDYHESKGSTFVNWNLAFNTWIRNDRKFSGTNGNGKGKGAERHERQIESLRATRKQAHEILRRREQTNQQDAMDFRQTADDVRGDEQTGAEWGSSGDNGAGSSQRVVRRSTS